MKRISETFNAQFRVEIFNALNHSNFNPPMDAFPTNRPLSLSSSCARQ